jgi:phosphatidylserine decarboxylase
MTIHKEGYTTLAITAVFLFVLNFVFDYYLAERYPLLETLLWIASAVFFLLILQFFRHPSRKLSRDDRYIISPADGKVVVIEETEESEVLKEKRIQVSIFMSPVNVHVNRYPVSGEVTYAKYHPGLYLVAWHPKSSTENERTTVVIRTNTKVSILLRQIAGAVARRIVCYPKEGWMVRQGEEMGFIKFGSRVDLFLPLNAKIRVKLNQKVRGGESIIAELENVSS